MKGKSTASVDLSREIRDIGLSLAVISDILKYYFDEKEKKKMQNAFHWGIASCYQQGE